MDMKSVAIALIIVAVLSLSAAISSYAAPQKGSDGQVKAPFPAELRCSATTARIGETIACRYDVGPSPTEPTAAVAAPGATIQWGTLASSASCTPADACVYSISGSFTVSYGAPGKKAVTLTACSAGNCVARQVRIRVKTESPKVR